MKRRLSRWLAMRTGLVGFLRVPFVAILISLCGGCRGGPVTLTYSAYYFGADSAPADKVVVTAVSCPWPPGFTVTGNWIDPNTNTPTAATVVDGCALTPAVPTQTFTFNPKIPNAIQLKGTEVQFAGGPVTWAEAKAQAPATIVFYDGANVTCTINIPAGSTALSGKCP